MTSSVPVRKFALSFVAAFALLCVMAPAQPAPSDRFKVRIKIDEASLHQPGFQQGGEFFVTTKVTNISHHEEQITAWEQPGWSWMSGNSSIQPGIEALHNVKEKISLAPDQIYSSQVEMWVNRGAVGPETFRLGFIPNATAPASTNQPQVNNWGGVFWSNYVTLKR